MVSPYSDRHTGGSDDDGSYVGVNNLPNSGASNVIDLVQVNSSEVNASVVVPWKQMSFLSLLATPPLDLPSTRAPFPMSTRLWQEIL